MPDSSLQEKHEALRAALERLGRVAVAFSGGADSTLLLAVAHDALPEAAVLALIGRSPSKPRRETEGAVSFCEQHGIQHRVIDTHEFEIAGFDHNPEDRCYLCKREMFSEFSEAARACGFDHLVEGSNADDAASWRPGERALSELHVASPLRDAGLSKAQVRALSKELGLPTWDKPSYSCLLSRFEYGQAITPERLAAVDASELALIELGFSQVRVRVAGDDARVELSRDDIERAARPNLRAAIVEALRRHGFVHVSLDLVGYRFGSMDEGHTPAR